MNRLLRAKRIDEYISLCALVVETLLRYERVEEVESLSMEILLVYRRENIVPDKTSVENLRCIAGRLVAACKIDLESTESTETLAMDKYEIFSMVRRVLVKYYDWYSTAPVPCMRAEKYEKVEYEELLIEREPWDFIPHALAIMDLRHGICNMQTRKWSFTTVNTALQLETILTLFLKKCCRKEVSKTFMRDVVDCFKKAGVCLTVSDMTPLQDLHHCFTHDTPLVQNMKMIDDEIKRGGLLSFFSQYKTEFIFMISRVVLEALATVDFVIVQCIMRGVYLPLANFIGMCQEVKKMNNSDMNETSNTPLDVSKSRQDFLKRRNQLSFTVVHFVCSVFELSQCIALAKRKEVKPAFSELSKYHEHFMGICSIYSPILTYDVSISLILKNVEKKYFRSQHDW